MSDAWFTKSIWIEKSNKLQAIDSSTIVLSGRHAPTTQTRVLGIFLLIHSIVIFLDPVDSTATISAIHLPRKPSMSCYKSNSDEAVDVQGRIYECRQRQIYEIEALSAIYDCNFVMSELEKEDFEIVKTAIESCTNVEDFSNEGMPNHLSFCVQQGFDTPELSHTVHLTFPNFYPLDACSVRIEWNAGKRIDNAHLTATIQQYAHSLVGEESGMQLIKVWPALCRSSFAFVQGGIADPPASSNNRVCTGTQRHGAG